MEETLLGVSDDVSFARSTADVPSFASFFWPRQGVSYQKLMDIHSKLVRTVSTRYNHLLTPGQGRESGPEKAKDEAEGGRGGGLWQEEGQGGGGLTSIVRGCRSTVITWHWA